MNVVVTTMLAAAFIQIGYFFWKLSAQKQVMRDERMIYLLRDRVWLAGSLSTSAGWLFFIKATSIGDISFVQPLMSAGDFLLVLMALLFLKERLVFGELCGIVLTLAGAVFLAWETVDSTEASYDPIHLVTLMLVTGLIAGILWFIHIRRKSSEVSLALIVGLAFGCGAVLTKAMTSDLPDRGPFFSLSLLASPLVIAVVAANMVGLAFLQLALRCGRASVIIPLQLSAANALAVTAGKLLFNEDITVHRSLAIAMIVLGTVLVQLYKPSILQLGAR